MRHKIRQRRRNGGGALISALFITALAAMLATALAVEQGVLIHEVTLIVRADQGYLNLQGEQFLAKKIILKYATQFLAKNPPSNITPLQAQLPRVKIDDMEISGTIENEQGKFNLNNLQYSQNQPKFAALLRAVDAGVSASEAENIAQSITAWITNGSQDPYYLSLHPPYRSSKTQLANVSELRLIAGVTPAIYVALKPYVTALPESVAPIAVTNTQTTQTAKTAKTTATTTSGTASSQKTAQQLVLGTPIDINAVSILVLSALDSSLNPAQAQDIIACRERYRSFSSTQAFTTDCAASLTNITVQSQYFLVRVTAVYEKHVLQLNSLMVTQPEKNNTLKVITVWQSFE